MGENSHISWTDNTFNYWIGCTKVSAGCDNCYAEREQDLRYGRAKWGKGNERYLTSEKNRKTPFKWEEQAKLEGRRIRVFTASLSDVFDEEVSDEWRDGLFNIILKTPHLDWLVLTKRLAKMLRYVRDLARRGAANIPGNVWWGCSVEDQATANQRIPELLKMRQFVGDAPLWLSVEPLIGSINLNVLEPNRLETFSALTGEGEVREGVDAEPTGGAHVDWVVVGGESGPNARPMHPDWARSLRDQCVAAGVAFHFKQWGEFSPNVCGVNDTMPPARVGKKAAGRLLDGVEWNEFPKPLP